MAKRRKQPKGVTSSQIYLAKRYAKAHGHFGLLGDWIYSGEGHLCHGWAQYFVDYKFSILAWSYKQTGLSGDRSYDELAAAMHNRRIK